MGQLISEIRLRWPDLGLGEAPDLTMDDLQRIYPEAAAACKADPATHAVAISDAASSGAPIIYLSHDGPADYRIFVRSRTFSQREAAALYGRELISNQVHSGYWSAGSEKGFIDRPLVLEIEILGGSCQEG